MRKEISRVSFGQPDYWVLWFAYIKLPLPVWPVYKLQNIFGKAWFERTGVSNLEDKFFVLSFCTKFLRFQEIQIVYLKKVNGSTFFFFLFSLSLSLYEMSILLRDLELIFYQYLRFELKMKEVTWLRVGIWWGRGCRWRDKL